MLMLIEITDLVFLSQDYLCKRFMCILLSRINRGLISSPLFICYRKIFYDHPFPFNRYEPETMDGVQ